MQHPLGRLAPPDDRHVRLYGLTTATTPRQPIPVLFGEPGFRLAQAGGDPSLLSARDLLTQDPEVASGWRIACLMNGLDLMGPTMMVSSAHDEAIVKESLMRFRRTFELLQAMGVGQLSTARGV